MAPNRLLGILKSVKDECIADYREGGLPRLLIGPTPGKGTRRQVFRDALEVLRERNDAKKKEAETEKEREEARRKRRRGRKEREKATEGGRREERGEDDGKHADGGEGHRRRRDGDASKERNPTAARADEPAKDRGGEHRHHHHRRHRHHREGSRERRDPARRKEKDGDRGEHRHHHRRRHRHRHGSKGERHASRSRRHHDGDGDGLPRRRRDDDDGSPSERRRRRRRSRREADADGRTSPPIVTPETVLPRLAPPDELFVMSGGAHPAQAMPLRDPSPPSPLSRSPPPPPHHHQSRAPPSQELVIAPAASHLQFEVPSPDEGRVYGAVVSDGQERRGLRLPVVRSQRRQTRARVDGAMRAREREMRGTQRERAGSGPDLGLVLSLTQMDGA